MVAAAAETPETLRKTAVYLSSALAPCSDEEVCLFLPINTNQVLKRLQDSPSASPASFDVKLKDNMDDMFEQTGMTQEEEELFSQLQ